MISTDDIADIFKLYSQLLDLHDIDSFKAKNYANASFRIDKLGLDLSALSKDEIEKIEGIGKSLASKIEEIKQTGSFKDLDELATKTPVGVAAMLKIKGIGPKKVGLIWRKLGIESIGELLYACNENRLVDVKGFGEKTQSAIIESIQFLEQNQGKLHYANAIVLAEAWKEKINASIQPNQISITGDIRRMTEIIEEIVFCIEAIYTPSHIDAINQFYGSETAIFENNILTLRSEQFPLLRIYYTSAATYINTLFETTANPLHLEKLGYITTENKQSEEAIYTKYQTPYIMPELREGLNEIEYAKAGKYSQLITYPDLKGTLHNHSKWSDGMHSIEEMALYCIEMGYEYLGMCDHSKTAVYANGLKEDRVRAQHIEINQLNQQLYPFKIFKGIESDILMDGSLDYSDEVLATFDFVVASIHQNLKMNETKATERLIKAIENKYTTILGHPTGRLLLSRPGYPIDHSKVIDACAANGVVIELNAHPYRLDIDWRWIDYAMSKGVPISINPDAHKKEGFLDMYFGVCAARKGGLTKDFTFNTLSRAQIETYFENRKRK
jgi:DNA polymerase (family 10)